MHIHLNYVDADGNNVFVDESGQESELMLHAAGGMCHWMASHMIFFAPKPESYKRLADPGRETPIKINWGGNNRTAAIRVPDTNNKRQFKRLEHRVPCADCEPDVAIAAVLASALYGIKHRIAPPQKTYGLSFEEQYGLESLPLSFEEAVSRSRGVEEALG
jgi:glutamine synthetase